MYKGKLDCTVCDKLYDFEFEEVSGLSDISCPECGSDDIFFMDIDFGEDKDNSGVTTGQGGCGGYRR